MREEKAANTSVLGGYDVAAAAVDWDVAIAGVEAVVPAAQFVTFRSELERMRYVGARAREQQSQATAHP